MSFVSRVFLEKIEGEYQGACFRFRDGLDCAALRLEWGLNGSMYIGQSNRGWNSLGTKSYSLQRLQWNGKIPFEIKTMSARHDGFTLTFTRPVNLKTATDINSYMLSSYTYPYHSKYGGKETDLIKLTIKSITTDNDKQLIHLEIDGLRAGYVHELHADGVMDSTGQPLVHKAAYYTLNRIPKK